MLCQRALANKGVYPGTRDALVVQDPQIDYPDSSAALAQQLAGALPHVLASIWARTVNLVSLHRDPLLGTVGQVLQSLSLAQWDPANI